MSQILENGKKLEISFKIDQWEFLNWFDVWESWRVKKEQTQRLYSSIQQNSQKPIQFKIPFSLSFQTKKNKSTNLYFKSFQSDWKTWKRWLLYFILNRLSEKVFFSHGNKNCLIILALVYNFLNY